MDKTRSVSSWKAMLGALMASLLVATLALFAAPGNADAANSISRARAKSIALADAGVSASKAKALTIEVDYEHGKKVYEVDFRTSTHKYEYDILAKNGKIYEKSIKVIKKAGKKAAKAKAPAKGISKSKAKSIALKHAKLTAKKVRNLKVTRDRYHGKAVWEVEFDRGAWEYEYDIAVSNGKILSWEREIDD